MLNRALGKASLLATCAAVSIAAIGLFGADAEKLFRPPRTGVVDISIVFEEYLKKLDRETEMKGETKAIEDRLKELEKRYKEIQSEIGNLAEGPKKQERQLEKYKLELEVKDYKEREFKRLEEKQLRHVQEIRDEIEAEIQAYAKSNDLDMVLEKTVTAARDGPRWPICHFAKPELDISREIVTRLNDRYRKR